MQNNSSLAKKSSKQQLSGHRRTHSSSDYDITTKFSKNRQISPKMGTSPKETNEPTPNSNNTQALLEINQKKFQETVKEYIIEPLELTPEQQRLQVGNAKYSNENLNFGKNIKNPTNTFYNSFSQLFNQSHNNKEAVVEKYKKQLEDQKISTILEKNDILSNEDSSFIEIDKLSPINKNASEYICKNDSEKPTYRKKKFHSNSHDLNIERNLINCGQKTAGHCKNSPSQQQQVFTIYLKDPNKNEKQLDKIINFLKVNKKVPDVNLQGLQNKSLKNNHSTSSFMVNSNMSSNQNSQTNTERSIKDLEKRVFLLENEVLGLRTENTKIKQNNTSLMKKLQEMGYFDSENMIQVKKS
jgi:hypothetical protein